MTTLISSVLGNSLCFRANDGTHGIELWKSNGTAAGTAMVKNIRPGANQSSTPNEFTTIGGTTYFVATNGKTGRELWKTNGTSASTSLVKDINPGSGGAGVASLHAFGTNLVFRANDGANGAEPWRSDGTPAGTVMIKDINTSAGFQQQPGRLRFAERDALLCGNRRRPRSRAVEEQRHR